MTSRHAASKKRFSICLTQRAVRLPVRRYSGRTVCSTIMLLMIALCVNAEALEKAARIDSDQVPTWSRQDMDFFLHGSMGTEVVPERVLRAFIKTYPDLFPTSDLSHLGLIPDSQFGWPIGLSRKNVRHLGGLSAVGINCASCHVAQITSTPETEPIRILGVTSHFDVEAFFGSILTATFRSSDPGNMKRLLCIYLNAEPKVFDAAWRNQQDKIVATIKNDPFGAKDVEPSELHNVNSTEVQQSFDTNIDLAGRAHSMLKLFHNMRAALHIPINRRKQRRRLPDPDATTRSGFLPPVCCTHRNHTRPLNLVWSGTWTGAPGCTGTATLSRHFPATCWPHSVWAHRYMRNMPIWNSRP